MLEKAIRLKEEGLKIKECSRCNEKIEEIIPVIIDLTGTEYNIIFDVICYTDEDAWVLDDYKIRPLELANKVIELLKE